MLLIFHKIFINVRNCIETGGDSSLQLEAAYCVANAATWEGENTNSSLLATVTGAYMITLLGSGNYSLQEACCWGMYRVKRIF